MEREREREPEREPMSRIRNTFTMKLFYENEPQSSVTNN